MRIEELFPTRTSIRLLDLLLEAPGSVASQNMLAKRLGVAPITLRRTVKRLEALGLVQVDINAGDIGINVVRLSETDLAKALLAFHKRLSRAS